MWNKIQAYLGERAMFPSWYDFFWLFPLFILQRIVSLFDRR